MWRSDRSGLHFDAAASTPSAPSDRWLWGGDRDRRQGLERLGGDPVEERRWLDEVERRVIVVQRGRGRERWWRRGARS